VELALKALLIKHTGARPQTYSLSALLEMLEKALGAS
jgi:HEPN domain-containing protein